MLGARLSGGGFGGSAVLLLPPAAVEHARRELVAAYTRRFGSPCDALVIEPSEGAHVVAV